MALAPGSAFAAAPHRLPDPLGIARELAAQRAGFGSPRHAAALAAQAWLQAGRLRAAARASGRAASVLGGTWTSLGPAPMHDTFYGGAASGRVDAVAVAPSGEMYVGAAGGGVWSSTDGGAHWVTHTDQVSSGLAIGALAIDPTNPQIIYAGTGEANNCGDCFYGGGVLKSTDGGATWTVLNPSGVFSGVDFSALAVDPSNDQHLYAATSVGLFESSDGGASWAQPTGTGDVTDPASAVVIDPAHPATAFVATVGLGVQESIDDGQNFTTLGGGLPAATTFGVTALAIGAPSATYPNADQTLYAAVALSGTTDPSNGGDLSLYRSQDGGATWTRLSATPAYTNQSYAYSTGSADQASYDNALAVDPANPQHVIAGGIAPVESTDGGATWSPVNGQSFFGPAPNVLHPDVHAVVFAPSGSVLLGTDGGLFGYQPSTPGAAGVSNLNGDLDTAQAYQDLGVYGAGSMILAGFQGIGTALYSGSRAWTDELSGDGGYNAINPLESHQQVAMSDGYVTFTTDSWNTASDITPPHEPDAAANFVTPMALVANPAAPDSPTVYYGGGDLWGTSDPADPAPAWTQLTRVGTGVSAIAAAPSDPAVLYVGFDDGTLLVSTNANSPSPTFTTLASGTGEWITHIAVDPADPGRVVLSFSSSNTHTSAVAPMVQLGIVSLLGTPSVALTDVTGDLPMGVASDSVVFDAGELVVATDVGVFGTDLGSLSGGDTAWTPVGGALPHVQVVGLTVDAAGNLYAATHGRGVWTLAGPAPGAPAELTPPTLSGSAVQGQTLTEAHGSWSQSAASYGYQWLRCATRCEPIPGATGQSYTLTPADVGTTVEVQETATTAGASSQPATSAPSDVVVAPAPGLLHAGAITGTPRVGSTLSAGAAGWSNAPTAFSYQWWRCRGRACSAIGGATAPRYVLRSSDLGFTIEVSETASNAGGSSAPATTAPVGPVAAAPGPAPKPQPQPVPPPTAHADHNPSPAQVRAAVNTVLAAPMAAGPASHRTYTVHFGAPGAGKLTLSWSTVAARPHTRALVLATLRAYVTRAGQLRLRIALTAAGRKLLSHRRRVRIAVTCAFTTSSGLTVRRQRRVWMTR